MQNPSEVIDLDSQPIGDLVSLVQAAKQKNGVRSRLSRATSILRYYRTSQLLQRAWRNAMPAFLARHPRALPIEDSVSVRDEAVDRFRDIATTRSVRTATSRQTLFDDLSQGKITLLEQACELGMPIDWHGRVAPSPSHLWHFQLHYHEYLLDLAVASEAKEAGETDAWPLIWQIVADWIDGNPLVPSQSDGKEESDAWHPFCISRRLPVWAQLFALCEPPEDLHGRFLQSFANQAEVLSKTLEFDLGGNHLLENLTALALAGTFLEGPQSERWLDLVTQHLQKQLSVQILPHGEHYERAPMYHCQVLGNLLRIAAATAGIREDLAEPCRQAALPMRDFLQSILHPDGEIPLFGDSCWGEAHAVGDINALANLVELEPVTENKSPVTVAGPYWIWRKDADALILDAGPVGAKDLPAHAHCDLLGFEASVEGERWLVDSGLFDYDDNEMRDYCRSSVAHNVVTVGHQNCCDVWSRFRMGRRGRPVRFDHGQQGRFSWCHASHDGYRRRGVSELSRLMVMHPSGVWICLEHSAKPSGTSLMGRLHLAPGIDLQQLEPQRLLLTKNGTQRWLTVTSGVELGHAEGWYCDRFGRKTRTQVITYHPRDSQGNRCTFGWSLSPTNPHRGTALLIDDATCQAEVAMDGDSERFHWQFSAKKAR